MGNKADYSPEAWERRKQKMREYKARRKKDPEWRKKNAAFTKAWYEKHKSYARAYARAYQEKHKELINARKKQKRRDDPDFARARDKRYRERHLKAWGAKLRRGDVTVGQFIERFSKTYVWLNEQIKRHRSGDYQISDKPCRSDHQDCKGEFGFGASEKGDVLK